MFQGGVMRYFIFSFLIILNSSAFACKTAPLSTEQHYQNASKVFRGTIVSSKVVSVSTSGFPITHEITILTSEVYKGYVPLLIIVNTSDSSASCGVGIDQSEQVFFVSSDNYTGQPLGSFRIMLIANADGTIDSILGESKINILRQLVKNET